MKTNHTKNLHIKCTNEEEANKWVTALSFFSNHYKFLEQEPWEVDDFNSINPRVMLVIMIGNFFIYYLTIYFKELEKKCGSLFYQKIQNFNSHSQKGFKTYFETIGYRVLENCMADSEMKKCYVDQNISKDEIKSMEASKNNMSAKIVNAPGKLLSHIGIKVLNPKALVFSIRRYSMLITEKGLYNQTHTEKSLLKVNDLPHWMHFDTIYM